MKIGTWLFGALAFFFSSLALKTSSHKKCFIHRSQISWDSLSGGALSVYRANVFAGALSESVSLMLMREILKI